MPDHLVVLIGSDGKQATVSRSVATQASLVLRDLLDGKDPTTTTSGGVVGAAGESVGAVSGEETANTQGSSSGTPTIELPFPYFSGDLLQRICAHMTYRYGHSPSGGGNRASLTGSGGSGGAAASAGSPRRNVMRQIPRPMVLPLAEYLDHHDRCFIENWDETTTVLMVKAATLLNYEELFNLASAKLATYLSEKSVEGIRAFLGVEGDFTPEEEAELKKEHEQLSAEENSTSRV